jgi:NTP pyrophosphatase (non-canonical NTP hydrolase)
MDVKEIYPAVEKIKQALIRKYDFTEEDKGLKYIQFTKLQEEIGELAEELLHYDKLQRSSKGDSSSENLQKEALDVLVTLLIFSSFLQLDLMKDLPKELERLHTRVVAD